MTKVQNNAASRIKRAAVAYALSLHASAVSFAQDREIDDDTEGIVIANLIAAMARDIETLRGIRCPHCGGER